MTEPLPTGHQVILQRLMASHVMTDEDVNALFEQLQEAEVDLGRSKTLQQALDKMNKQLKRGFGLEIATMVSTPDIYPPAGQKFHAIIDQHADDVSKESFLLHFDIHQRAYIRLLLEHLVAEHGPVARSTLINQRMDLQEPCKLSLDAAEMTIEKLIDERWLSMVDGMSQRRQSMSASIQLGPRAYLELSHLLTELGFPKDELPQFIYYH